MLQIPNLCRTHVHSLAISTREGLKAAVMGNWKWAVHDSDLWDYHVTAVAASSKAQSQSGPSAQPYGQPGCLMGYQRPPTKPVLITH